MVLIVDEMCLVWFRVDLSDKVIMQGFLSIELCHLHVRHDREIRQEYISFMWEDNFYFSRTYSQSQLVNFSIPLQHTMLLPIDELPFRNIMLQVWENHMIVFEHQVDISELNTRKITRKRIQIRQGEILEFCAQFLIKQQLVLTTAPNPHLLQHFLILDHFVATNKGQDQGPSYFQIECKDRDIIVPVVNSMISIPLPNTLRFWHIKNGKKLAYSKEYDSQDLQNEEMKVEMIVKEDNGYDLDVRLKWASNISHGNNQHALLGAHDILLYDIEIRFEAKEGMKVDVRPEHVAGIKFKVNAGPKCFELNGDLDPFKSTRFARIVYFIIKSDEEDFSFVLQKGPRIVAKAIIGTDELLSYHPNIIRRKLLDPFSGRVVASVRCRAEKAKNLSLPQNNRFWKQCSQNKQQVMMLELSQVSLFGPGNTCSIVIKSQEEEAVIPDVLDFSVFKLETQLPEPITLSIHQEGKIYLKLIPSGSQDSDLGMAVINPKELRLGAVPLNLSFYKQKEIVSEARLIVNKVMPWPFVRGVYQTESPIGSGVKTMSLSIMLKGLELTSYYWTYQYEGKGDIYCIFELNRVKKVLILEKVESTKKLLFLSAPGSDLLNFLVDHQESFKVKLTILATDQGIEEEIYGTVQKRAKIDDLNDGPVLFKKQPIANYANLQVGEVDFEIQKGLIGEFKKAPVKKELNLVKQDLDKINKSIEIAERKFNSPKNIKNRLRSKKRFDSLVLPEIKDPKQERLKRFAKMLEARQKRKKSPKIHAMSMEASEEVNVSRRNRVKSQGLNGIKQKRSSQLQDPLPPIPHTVQQEQYHNEKEASELHIELPIEQFEENEFVEDEGKGKPPIQRYAEQQYQN